MKKRPISQKVIRTMAAFSFSGVLFASSCSSSDIRDLASELDTLANQVDQAPEVSWQDFLLSQFKD